MKRKASERERTDRIEEEKVEITLSDENIEVNELFLFLECDFIDSIDDLTRDVQRCTVALIQCA